MLALANLCLQGVINPTGGAAQQMGGFSEAFVDLYGRSADRLIPIEVLGGLPPWRGAPPGAAFANVAIGLGRLGLCQVKPLSKIPPSSRPGRPSLLFARPSFAKCLLLTRCSS